ncbi:MAG: hypothetical protein Q9166_008230, partial [cf. Caloplaca sp. 2 TL-2023]
AIMPLFANPFNPSSISLLGGYSSSNYNKTTGRFEKKQEPSVVPPAKRRNAGSQIELAAQIVESTEIPAVEAHEKAKARKVKEYTRFVQGGCGLLVGVE